MDDILKDSRFTELINDARYRQIPKKENKLKIDKRFRSMFENEKFKVKYTVDKRGRPVNHTSSENLRKYYDLSSESSDSTSEEEDGEKPGSEDGDRDSTDKVGKYVRRPVSPNETNVEDENCIENDESTRERIPNVIRKKLRDLDTDYARGEGELFSDSSSDEDVSEYNNDEEIEHDWGELDADAETCEEPTYRLAVCNMDWDNIKASDMYVLFSSFLPAGGLIKSVIIYPSEYGIKRMQEEELKGPVELTETKIEADSEDDMNNENEDEGSKYHMEKLRKYQLNRLKYYYAVIIFDSASTANKIYTECDGIEYESSAARLDLRFIPDKVTFDQGIHDECQEAPEVGSYKPHLFTTTALQQAKVELTWDASNPHRKDILKEAAAGGVKDEDLKNYLACSSSDEENDVRVSSIEDKSEKTDPLSKYKNILHDIEESEKKKKNQDIEMEITWGLGLKEKTEDLVKKKMNTCNKLTPFEEMIEKQKEKKKIKKLERKKKAEEKLKNTQSNESSDEIPSDIDMNDPYFAEEFQNKEFKNNIPHKKKGKNHEEKVEENGKENLGELELLLSDDDDDRTHFSLKKIQEAENQTKSKRKNKNIDSHSHKGITDFEVNADDNRFSALYTSHHFNIDPTDPNFKKTNAMEKLIQEKLKRRPREEDNVDVYKKPKTDHSTSSLVNSIKSKTARLNRK